MDQLEIEWRAEDMYRRCKLDPARPESALKIARRLYGPDVIQRDANLVGARPAASGWANGKPYIALRRTVPLDEVRFNVGHELFHIELGRAHNNDPQLEKCCDYGSACLMAPRQATLALHRAFGIDFKAIAKECAGTETWAALRVAEATRMPLATVGPIAVRVRGPEEFVWPEEQEIRSWGTRPRPGIRKIRIADRPKRAAFLVE